MARRRQHSRNNNIEDPENAEAIALLPQDHLGQTGAADADQYDENAPLNDSGLPGEVSWGNGRSSTR